jgi:methionine-rich copper-binding protein CopC
MTRRIPALILGALIGVALIPQQSLAHAAYKDSDPKDGETVSSPPSRVTAEFTEQIVEDYSYLEVFDPCGRQVDNRDSLVVHDRITLSISGEARGVYVVRFNVVSAVDGHPTVGSFDFTASGGSECPAQKPPPAQQEASSGGKGPGSSTDAGSGTSAAPVSGSSGSRDNSPRGDAGTKVRGKRTGERDAPRARDEETAGDALAAASPSPEQRRASVWEGIPMGWFAVALGMAAIVGAAGGFVYAGIVGPRRI